jgi:hypothetical protein
MRYHAGAWEREIPLKTGFPLRYNKPPGSVDGGYLIVYVVSHIGLSWSQLFLGSLGEQ